jgi:hypothetical protein
MKEFIRTVRRYEAAILICFCALLRLPSLSEPYWYGDEGTYLTIGTAVRRGLRLYGDIYDNKTPVIYLLAALTGSLFWFRLLLLVWNSISIAVFYSLSKQFTRHSAIATLLFVVLPFRAEANIANGEIFMVLPTLVGVWLLLRSPQTTRTVALSGLAFSFAFLIKAPAFLDAAAAGLFFYFISPYSSRVAPAQMLKSAYPYLFAVCFITPILVSLLYYAAIDAGPAYVASAFTQNIDYLSAWARWTQTDPTEAHSGLKIRALLLSGSSVVLFLLSRRMKKETTFLLLWFLFALFAALLSERPYPHYLMQIIPPFVLLMLHAIETIRREKTSRIIVVGVILLLWVTQAKIHFWHYKMFPYFKNYVAFVTGGTTRDQYYSTFDPRMPEIYSVADTITARTSPSDRIFIWGNLPTLYALTRRLPPGRYTTAFHIQDFNGFDETIQAFETRQPKLIVLDKTYDAKFPALFAAIAKDYRQTSESATLTIYQSLKSLE